MVQETFTLPVGLTFQDAQHKSVTMRPAIIADTLEAEKESEGRSVLYLTLALICKQIVRFGTIPVDRIDVDLLSQLCDADFERLNEVRDYLKKKVIWQSES